MASILLFPRDVRHPIAGRCSWIGAEREKVGRGMRTVTDSARRAWTIFEVKRSAGGDQWTYLPAQFGNGWLCFESDVAKRRLTPVPSGWSRMSDAELLGLLKKAQPVVRARAVAETESHAK
jgi:hypothetical protein